MNHRPLLLALAVGAAALTLAACQKESSPTTAPAAGTTAPTETADQFIARVNAEYKALYPEMTSAQWLSSTYINDDSERVAAKANERWLTILNGWIAQAGKYDGQPMSEDTRRQIHLLKLMTAMPAPRDPAKLGELTRIASRMEGAYGSGKYCTDEANPATCRQLGDLEEVLASSRDYDKQLDAWQGWHATTKPMRADYQRFVGLVNEGAKEMGFADAGQMWRSGYDMPPEQIGPETDRLWEQVKPMYEQLHCYARTKLDGTYGKDKAETEGGLIAAHLLGNMWQQDWSNLWDQLQPYPGAGSLDITAALEKQYQANLSGALAKAGGSNANVEALYKAQREAELRTAKQMTERAQDFYVSLASPPSTTSWATSITTWPTTRCRRCSRAVPTMASTKRSATPSCWR
ncbi:MAG: peptidase [Stenotrophomonas rhizophila]|nr:peptidase [Stenotrophomonas rhizophila]